MPKIVTEKEKESIRDSMYKEGLRLVRQKGLLGVTVDDVVLAVGIAKGTFYSYYKSKEEFLHATLKRWELELMERMFAATQREGTLKSKVIYMFLEVFLGEESIALYLKPAEVEVLLKKMPEMILSEQKKAQGNNDKILSMLGITPSGDRSTALSYLSDCLIFVSTSDILYYDEKGRKEALEILANAIGDYICKLAEENG